MWSFVLKYFPILCITPSVSFRLVVKNVASPTSEAWLLPAVASLSVSS